MDEVRIDEVRIDEVRTRFSWRKLALVLGLVTLACLPKLGNAFVWDDLALIIDSDFIHDSSNILRAFMHDTMYAADAGAFQAQAGLDTYRPVTLMSFFADAAISGRNPIAYHLDNLIVHLLCTTLVMLFAARFLSDAYRGVAPWAALWFGLHPVLGEAHLWVNGRSDLWSTLFGLSALMCWWRDPTQPEQRMSLTRHVGVYALCLLGLLSKETLGPALLVALVWDAGFFHRDLMSLRLSRTWVLRSLPIAFALASYLALRTAVLQGLHASAGAPQLLRALGHLPLLIQDGLIASVAPTRLMPRYLLEEYTTSSGWQLFASVVVVAVLVGAILGLRKRWPQGSFGLAWFAITLAPVSLISTLAWYGFGRYLYLPFAILLPVLSEGAARAVQYASSTSPRLGRAGKWIAVFAMAVFAIRLALSGPQWDGPEAFYRAIAAEDPYASHGVGGMGKLLVESGQPAQAIPLLELAVLRNGSDDRYLNNLAVSYLRTASYEQALRATALGGERFPSHAKFPYVRALALVNAGSPHQVAVALAQALEIDLHFKPARSLLAELCTAHPARADYRRALEQVIASRPKLRSAQLLPE